MVALKAVLITAVIDTMGDRDVVVTDIPGAYLSANMDDVVHMLLKGRLKELMVMAAPELYRTYVLYDINNRSVLYVRLTKAL